MMTRFLLLAAVALTAVTAQAQKAELTFGVSAIVRHVREPHRSGV